MRKLLLVGFGTLLLGVSAQAQVYTGGEEDGYASHSFGPLVNTTVSAEVTPAWEIRQLAGSNDFFILTEYGQGPESGRLTAADGRELAFYHWIDASAKRHISLEDLPAGLYLLQLERGERKDTFKLIVRH